MVAKPDSIGLVVRRCRQCSAGKPQKVTEVFSDSCERFGISRKTGYKWLRRYREPGIAGTRELSRRPDRCPHRTPAKIGALADAGVPDEA